MRGGDIAVRATTRAAWAVLLAVVTVVTATPGVGAGREPASAAGRPTGIVWRLCPDDPAAQCGTLRVPVDWDAPYGPTVDIAVARRRATGPAARIGALVVNPGGPGGSGVDFALNAERFFSPALRSRFDIVGFDPRGVGRSNPVVCSASLVAEAPSPLVTSAAAYDDLLAYNRRLAADCRRRTGPVFGHVDSISVVRDIEALRVALGERDLSFYGASYGTLMGQQYAERYPRQVRAVVLDSTMDHSTGTSDFLTAETEAVQDSFEEFRAWCARDADCVLRGRDIRALWSALIARADRGSLRDPFDPAYRLTVFDLINVAFSSFYEPQWYALAFYLDAVAGGTVGSDRGRASARAAARRAGLAERRAWPGPGGAPAERTGGTAVVEHSFPAIFCEDWSLPLRDYRQYAAELRRLSGRAPQMLVSPLALSAVAGCLGWPSRPNNPQRRIAPATTGPLLLINARHDPATAYPWARSVAAQLGGAATLVPYDGWGHVVYGRSACVTSVVDRYLGALWTPPPGASCPAVPPDPFGVGRRAAAVEAPPGPRPGVRGWSGISQWRRVGIVS